MDTQAAVDIAGLFGKAPIVALNILKHVPAEKLDSSHLPEARFRLEIETFYNERYDELLDEASNPSIEFTNGNPIGSCAQTGHERFATIYIDLDQCKKSISTVGDAARLLIGEYIHHFGKGDEFTDWAKLVIVASWSNRFRDQAIRLFRSYEAFGRVDSSVDPNKLVDKVFLVPDVSNPDLIMFVRSRNGINVVLTTPDKLGGEVQLINITTNPVYWNQNEKSLVTQGVWHLTGHANRPHYTGLMERHPRWFEKPFQIKVQVFGKDSALKVTYQKPKSVDLLSGKVQFETIQNTYLRQPGEDVINALFKKN